MVLHTSCLLPPSAGSRAPPKLSEFFKIMTKNTDSLCYLGETPKICVCLYMHPSKNDVRNQKFASVGAGGFPIKMPSVCWYKVHHCT